MPILRWQGNSLGKQWGSSLEALEDRQRRVSENQLIPDLPHFATGLKCIQLEGSNAAIACKVHSRCIATYDAVTEER
jgi:hypothetical protein